MDKCIQEQNFPLSRKIIERLLNVNFFSIYICGYAEISVRFYWSNTVIHQDADDESNTSVNYALFHGYGHAESES